MDMDWGYSYGAIKAVPILIYTLLNNISMKHVDNFAIQ